MTINLNKYKLIIFDLDSTIAETYKTTLLPNVKLWFENNTGYHFAMATNQGGVGLRYWMEQDNFGKPEPYPAPEDIETRLRDLQAQLPPMHIFKAYAYQSPKTGEWSPAPGGMETTPDWHPAYRKPNPGMLILAMTRTGISPDETLMVGDMDADKFAAQRAGCDFIHADIFFNRT